MKREMRLTTPNINRKYLLRVQCVIYLPVFKIVAFLNEKIPIIRDDI